MEWEGGRRGKWEERGGGRLEGEVGKTEKGKAMGMDRRGGERMSLVQWSG